MPRTFEYEDPRRIELIEELKKASKENKAGIWKSIATELSRSRRNRKEVNIRRLNKYTSDNETAIIPGKLLGDGNLDHKVTVAAFKLTEGAKEKVEKSGGNIISIQDLIKKNPKGSKIKIIG